jgi:hypothetical protein
MHYTQQIANRNKTKVLLLSKGFTFAAFSDGPLAVILIK